MAAGHSTPLSAILGPLVAHAPREPNLLNTGYLRFAICCQRRSGLWEDCTKWETDLTLGLAAVLAHLTLLSPSTFESLRRRRDRFTRN